MFKLTPKQDKAMDVLRSDATHIALGGGGRCIAGDSILDGHTKTIKELAEIGEPVMVMTTHGCQVADAPYLKGSDNLLKIVTETGKEIEVTSDHRFWDGSRWIHARDVKEDSLLACLLSGQTPPATILDASLSGLRASSLFSCRGACDTPLKGGYKLEKVAKVTRTTVQDYYTLHVPATEQYFANGILHHNSGKSFLLLRAVLIRAFREPGSKHAIFRFTLASIKGSLIGETLPDVFKLCFPDAWDQCIYNKQDCLLTLPNESEIIFSGLDDKERTEKILGQEYVTIYFNECSQIPWNSVITALTRLAAKSKTLKLKAYYDFNPPSKKHWTYLRFVEKKDPITKAPVAKPESYGFYLINPEDNKENISEQYFDILDSLPEKARNRFKYGKFADDNEGALWTEELLAQNRVLGHHDSMPDFLRIVVAVDPSGASGPEDTRSDEIGIAVCALGVDNHGYLLEDLSGRYGPEEWGQIAVETYRRHKADAIIGESNFGGDMVRSVIHAYDSTTPFRPVTASRGKVVRAEPISSLYQQGKIHHVGYFLELEDQLCGMTTAGYMGVKSPDRADSMVWGFTELFPEMTKKVEQNQRPSRVISPKRSSSRFAR